MGGMGGGLNMNMIKQAQKMQQDMMKAQAELEAKEYTATAGGGAVTAVAEGTKKLKTLSISPDAVDPDDVEMLQDMVIAAVNEALKQAADEMEASMQRFTGGLGGAGLF